MASDQTTGMGAAAPLPIAEQVWDPVVRAFHWALVVAFVGTFALGKFGPDQMTLHFIGGYTIAALVVLRLVWGIIGPRNAQFSSFVKGPRAVLAYARTLPDRKPSRSRGHNPLGALFVVGILLVLGLQVMTGLLADPEDYINAGPLAGYVSVETARKALALHEPLAMIALIGAVLHVLAIGFYKRWKREDLITPMITGRRRNP